MSLEDLTKLLASITPRERDVLKRKFGITLGDNPTIEEIRALTSITRERIEEIEMKALKKLRSRDKPLTRSSPLRANGGVPADGPRAARSARR